MGPKKAKGKMPVDGVDTTSMSREQLEAFCIRLREELDREREERNFFQLERDKLRTFWEITRQQLEESRAKQRNQDRAIDELEEKHQAEIKVYKQKVKHLLYEHQCNLSELKVESMVSLKQAQDDYNAMEQQLLKDKKELKEQIHELELAHLEEVRQLKIDHSAEVSRIREQLESDAAELEKKYESRLTNQAEEQAMREKMEQAELETRKNQHIVDLTKQHDAAFQEMKNYYNDITLNNLALISSLKEQMEELKGNHDRMEKQLNACQAENKKIAEPYKQAQSELGLLKRQLAAYEQDKVTLANTKQRLSLITKELEDLRWENDVLELRFEKVEKERDRLHAEFVGAVLDVQQKTGLKGALLEKRMSSMRSGVSQIAGVSVIGARDRLQSSLRKTTRPATAPWGIPSSSSPDRVSQISCRRRALFNGSGSLFRRPCKPLTRPDDDVVASRFESGVFKDRYRFKRPHVSEHSKARWIKAFKSSSTRTERTDSSATAPQGAAPKDSWAEVLNELRSPRKSSGLLEESEPQTKDCWWTIPEKSVEKKEPAPVGPCVCGQHVNGCRLPTSDKTRQGVEPLDLTYNYLCRNYMKHRYYPQILDCVRQSLSPIHSQEHPSDASIHDDHGSDKPAASHQPQEDRRTDAVSTDPPSTSKVTRKIWMLRPFSASMSDGRDTKSFTKTKSHQLHNFSRANTAASLCDASKVFREFMPLPPRPDLPWLHGVKSRYFSVHSSQRKTDYSSCLGRATTADIEIQASEEASPPVRIASEKTVTHLEKDHLEKPSPDECNSSSEKKSSADDQTQCYLSQIFSTPLQLSYSSGQMDRNYTALVTTPKIGDFRESNVVTNNFVRAQTEDSPSLVSSIEYPQNCMTNVGKEDSEKKHDTTLSRRLALSMWYSYMRQKSRKTDFQGLSISPVRHVDITVVDSAENTVGSAQSSPAIETPANTSHEDTAAGFSSLSIVSQPDSKKSSESKEDRKSDTLVECEQVDLENSVTQRVNQDCKDCSFATAEKLEGVSLKRRLKPTFPKRLKLKLMICSYLHRYGEEGDVNYVHPSAKQKSVDTGSGRTSQETCYMVGGSFDSKDNDQESVLDAQEKEKAVDRRVSTEEIPSCQQGESSDNDLFCCVCQSKMASLGVSSEGDQICCVECTKQANAPLKEWECLDMNSCNTEFDDLSNDVFSRGRLVDETLKKEFHQSSKAGNVCIMSVGRLVDENLTLQVDQSSNSCSDCMSPNARIISDHFLTESCSHEAVKFSAKLDSGPFQTKFRKAINAVDNVTSMAKPDGDSVETEIRAIEAEAKCMFSRKSEEINDTAACNDNLLKSQLDMFSKSRTLVDIYKTGFDDAEVSIPQLKLEELSSNTTGDECAFSEANPRGDDFGTSLSSTPPADELFYNRFTSDSFERHFPTESDKSFEERADPEKEPVLITLSCVQDAIRSAMKMINPWSRPPPVPIPAFQAREETLDDVSSLPTPATTVSDSITPVPAVQHIKSPELCSVPSDLKCEVKKSARPQKSTNVENFSSPRTSLTDEAKKSTVGRSRRVDSSSSTKPLQICPLAVPPGTLKGDPQKIVYTEYPVQTYNFAGNKLGCVSKRRNMLVFYEVSKIKTKDAVVKTKKPSVDNEEVKDTDALPRVSETKLSQVTLRPSSVFISDDALVVDIRKEAVSLPTVSQEERVKSVGATANFPCGRNNGRFLDILHFERKRVCTPRQVPLCETKFDLIVKRRREAWTLPGKGPFSKEICLAESGKFRHRSARLNEDDVRLPRGRQESLNVNRDKGCQCLERGRKCNCSLTQHLHIRPLSPPRPRHVSPLTISPKDSERRLVYDRETGIREKCSDTFRKNTTFSKSEDNSVGGTETLTSKQLSRTVSPPCMKPASMKNTGTCRRLSSLSRPEKAKANDIPGRFETMPLLIEEPLSGNLSGNEKVSSPRIVEVNSMQQRGIPSVFVEMESAPRRVSPAVPIPPPPSPNAYPPSPPTAVWRDRLPRRRVGNVSYRETRKPEDETDGARFLPQLSLRRRPQSEDNSFDKRKNHGRFLGYL